MNLIIDRINTIEEIEPIYKEYLAYMSRFFEITHYDAWIKTALKYLQRYSNEKDRYIFIIKKANAIIGFALINKHLRFNKEGFAVAEFYLKKNHERNGYGRMLAEYVFSTFPGDWEIAVSLKNDAARFFWIDVVSSYTHNTFMEKEKPGLLGLILVTS